MKSKQSKIGLVVLSAVVLLAATGCGKTRNANSTSTVSPSNTNGPQAQIPGTTPQTQNPNTGGAASNPQALQQMAGAYEGWLERVGYGGLSFQQSFVMTLAADSQGQGQTLQMTFQSPAPGMEVIIGQIGFGTQMGPVDYQGQMALATRVIPVIPQNTDGVYNVPFAFLMSSNPTQPQILIWDCGSSPGGACMSQAQGVRISAIWKRR